MNLHRLTELNARLDSIIGFAVEGVTRNDDGSLSYRGERFPGFNKPKRAPAGSGKKFVVLAKKGDKVKKVGYGARGYQDFRQHKDSGRRANYLARSGGIKNKDGQLTKNDKFSANYWARRELW